MHNVFKQIPYVYFDNLPYDVKTRVSRSVPFLLVSPFSMCFICSCSVPWFFFLPIMCLRPPHLTCICFLAIVSLPASLLPQLFVISANLSVYFNPFVCQVSLLVCCSQLVCLFPVVLAYASLFWYPTCYFALPRIQLSISLDVLLCPVGTILRHPSSPYSYLWTLDSPALNSACPSMFTCLIPSTLFACLMMPYLDFYKPCTFMYCRFAIVWPFFCRPA